MGIVDEIQQKLTEILTTNNNSAREDIANICSRLFRDDYYEYEDLSDYMQNALELTCIIDQHDDVWHHKILHMGRDEILALANRFNFGNLPG